MSNPPVRGDVITLPDPASTSASRIVVSWSQSWSNRSEEYYPIMAHNKSKDNAEVMIYIAAERFNRDHLESIANKEGENYELTIDDKIQFGQKNASGESRFLVYHDKSRKPYQHRFFETSVLSAIAKMGGRYAEYLDQIGLVNPTSDILKRMFGDYLHTF